MRITFPKQTDTNPSLLYTAGRIAFHFMVGAFLAFVPLSAVILQKLFILEYRDAVLLALWFMLASLYAYLRVTRELSLTVVSVPAPNLWKAFFLRQAVSSVLMGAFLGGVVISLFISGHAFVFAIAGGVTMLLLFAFLYKLHVEKEQLLMNGNRGTIVEWIRAGSTDAERNRRINYATSGALYLGAGEAGVVEDVNAPQLIWPEVPTVPQFQFVRANTEPTVINPSSGLPMSGNSTVGFDGAGNAYGTSSNKLFDD